MPEPKRFQINWFNPGRWLIGIELYRDPGFSGQISIHLGPLVSMFIRWNESYA